MKILSLQQPFAWLLAQGFKDIENRDWKPSNPGLRFRGKFLIHASLTWYLGASEAEWRLEWGWPDIEQPAHFDLGGIVGEAEIVDLVKASDSRWFFGPYGFVVRNARPLPFQPCRGMPGFFDLDWVGPKKEKVILPPGGLFA